MRYTIIFIILFGLIFRLTLYLSVHSQLFLSLLRYLHLAPPLGAPGGFQNISYFIPALIFTEFFAMVFSFLITVLVYVISNKLLNKDLKLLQILLIPSYGLIHLILVILNTYRVLSPKIAPFL